MDKIDRIKRTVRALSILLLLNLSPPDLCFAWSEKVHTYIAEKAGIKIPGFTNIPDLIRDDNYDLNAPLHWHFAAPDTVVTSDYIDRFKLTTGRCGVLAGKTITINAPNSAGILYWETVVLFQKLTESRGWIYDYYLFMIAHFISDLSQPLHNYPRGTNPAGNGKIYPEIGAWSLERHREFDKILDDHLPPDGEMDKLVNSATYEVNIESVDDLKREIARIANSAIKLANQCYAGKRSMTKEEAIRQIAMSISLLKSVMAATNGNSSSEPLLDMPN